MKNILVIDGAENCVYDIYAIDDEDFLLIFPEDQDIEFIEDLMKRLDEKRWKRIFEKLWQNRVMKKEVQGIHGTLFYGLYHKKQYYPAKRDEGARNPDGSLLR